MFDWVLNVWCLSNPCELFFNLSQFWCSCENTAVDVKSLLYLCQQLLSVLHKIMETFCYEKLDANNFGQTSQRGYSKSYATQKGRRSGNDYRSDTKRHWRRWCSRKMMSPTQNLCPFFLKINFHFSVSPEACV